MHRALKNASSDTKQKQATDGQASPVHQGHGFQPIHIHPYIVGTTGSSLSPLRILELISIDTWHSRVRQGYRAAAWTTP